MKLMELYQKCKEYVDYIENHDEAQFLLAIESGDFEEAMLHKQLEDVTEVIDQSEKLFKYRDNIIEPILEEFLQSLPPKAIEFIALAQIQEDPITAEKALERMRSEGLCD